MYWSDTWFQLRQGMGEFRDNLLHYFYINRRAILDPSLRLDGQVIILTGANRNIGKAIAEDLCSRGARVIMACRNMQLAEAAASDIRIRVPRAQLVCYLVDLASFQSIRSFVTHVKEREKRIDVLINNAGVFMHSRRETEDGFEMMIGVNYLAPVYLTLLLMDFMRSTSPDPRIISVGSLSHMMVRGIQWKDLHSRQQLSCSLQRAWRSYGHSKLAITLFSKELAQRTRDKGIRVYAVDPGIAPTQLIVRDIPNMAGTALLMLMPRPLIRTVSESAASVVTSVLHPRHAYSPDRFYYCDGREKELSPPAQSDENAERLWNMTTQLLQSMSAL